ncbi:MAG: acyltransferase [Elusimicrobiota bacterium]
MNLQTLTRTLGRYLLPCFARSLYYSLRYRCLVSARADLQLSSQIRLSPGVNIRPYVRLITTTGAITLGKHCGVNSFTMLAAGSAPIAVGDYVNIGPNVTLIAGNYGFDDPDTPMMFQKKTDLGIVVEDDVWIGAGAVILDGVRLGRGCVIGAGAVVTRDVPPLSIAVGNPARVVRRRGEARARAAVRERALEAAV